MMVTKTSIPSYQSRPLNVLCVYYIRYPNKEAGQVPMAYVVRKAGSSLSGSQVMDFVAEQVCLFGTLLNNDTLFY
jgi:hypothetical protein